MFNQPFNAGNGTVKNKYERIKSILSNKNDDYCSLLVFGKTKQTAVTIYFIDESRQVVYDLFIESAQHSLSSAICHKVGYIFDDGSKTEDDYWNDLQFFHDKNMHENIEFEYVHIADHVVEVSALVKEMVITRDTIKRIIDKIREIADTNNIDFMNATNLSKYNWIGEKISETDIIFDKHWIEKFDIDIVGELSEFEK